MVSCMNISKDRYLLIEEYLNKLLIVNENINLTSITDFDKAKILHIEDSLSAFNYFSDYFVGDLIDIGSGCGFPGVALSIASSCKTVLLDSSKKKMNAVHNILVEMNLDSQISTISARAEDFALQNRKFHIVVSRAVASLPSILELSVPFISDSGLIILYKSDIASNELSDGNSILDILGLKIFDICHFHLSDGVTRRTLLVFQKDHEPLIKLPRRNGLAQKRPLSRK